MQGDQRQYESSIVIPVFNKWNLTRVCLKSLAATTDRERVEVIVVDNASSDVTPEVCPSLGQKLFGDSFRYLRNEQNRNFAGASNQGALAARGEYVIFLNNDTDALPGWYEPLIEDFSRFDKIAATGPILLYPPDEIFGATIQHLGVLVTPFYKLGHLHSGISANSPLAQKRRFFQVITAACMVMPRQLFLDSGMFDERFVNGFEDVDLCARLWHEGWRMTINPDSKVVHYESQSAGRHDHEIHNGNLLTSKSLLWLDPDWHLHLEQDGLHIKVTDWLYFSEAEPPAITQKLDQLATAASREQILELLTNQPYWENGLNLLAEKTEDYAAKQAIFKKAFQMHKNPEVLIKACELALAKGDRASAKMFLATFSDFDGEPETFLSQAQNGLKLFEKMGIAKLADQFRSWIARYPEFGQKQEALARTVCELQERANMKKI